MNIDLSHTKSSAILTALTDARHRSGTAALGMVLTLVVDVDEIDHHDAMRAALAAAREHPCRIVTVIRRAASAPPRLDAEIRVGEEGSLAEVIVLRLYGVLRDQADSIVLPLLLPDAPVLVWWPGQAPAVPSQDSLGLLAQRRVTDAAAARKPLAVLKARSQDHSPGDTDLAWTRLTPWRTLLAAALDQPFDPIVGAEVSAAGNNPSAELLATWLEDQLAVPVSRKQTRGPGLTGARLITKRGHITIARPDGRLATLERTGQPNRSVALPRRSTEELLAEELRRLDPDDIYNETIRRVFGARPAPSPDEAGSQARPSTTARAMRRKPPMPPSKRAPRSVTANGDESKNPAAPRRATTTAKQAAATTTTKKTANKTATKTARKTAPKAAPKAAPKTAAKTAQRKAAKPSPPRGGSTR
jgi:glucose-6-phosphate dehydrogenase assembly protein OpcA